MVMIVKRIIHQCFFLTKRVASPAASGNCAGD